MSKLLDINGKELQNYIDLGHMDFEKLKNVQFDRTWCPIGTELEGQYIQTLIEKDDVVYKLHLVFGTQVFQARMSVHEVNPESLKKQWNELFIVAIAHFQNGYDFRDQIKVWKKAEAAAKSLAQE